MNAQTLHSALISLYTLTETLQWARRDLIASDETSRAALETFLHAAAREISMEKAALARAVNLPGSAKSTPGAVGDLLSRDPAEVVTTRGWRLTIRDPHLRAAGIFPAVPAPAPRLQGREA